MIPGFLILLLLVAEVDWVAVAKNWKKLEYIAKPAVMLILLGPLVGGFRSFPLICFGLGIFFSLAGDVFLMISFARFSSLRLANLRRLAPDNLSCASIVGGST